MRAGTLPAARLELAAHLGDPAARAALGLPPSADIATDRDLRQWLAPFAEAEPSARLRILLAASSLAPAVHLADHEWLEARWTARAAVWGRAPLGDGAALESLAGGLDGVVRIAWDLCWQAYGGAAPETLSPDLWRSCATRVIETVRAQVAPWALGEGDPLLDGGAVDSDA